MKKEDIEKILKEADSVLGNFTDGELRSHLTISKNRASKNQCSKGGKIGGHNHKKNKTGLFSMTRDKLIEACKNGAKAQSIEDKAKGGRIGGKLRKDKGKKVIMIDKITNKIIKKFPAVSTAARFLDKRENKIRDVLSGRRKTAYGFIWKFEK